MFHRETRSRFPIASPLRTLALLTLAILAVLATAAACSDEEQPAPDETPAGVDAKSLGPADAPVTVVDFSDFQ